MPSSGSMPPEGSTGSHIMPGVRRRIFSAEGAHDDLGDPSRSNVCFGSLEGIGQAMVAWSSASSNVIAPGFHEVQERAVKLAKENADAAFKLAKDVAQAKDLQELIDLQTRYVQSQMKWYAYQSQEFGRLMAKAISDTKKTQS